jgi:hypothetical protein
MPRPFSLNRGTLATVTRRLRLALLLAALAVAGPSAAAPQAFQAARTQVGVVWLRVSPARHFQQQQPQAVTPVDAAARAKLSAQPDHLLPDSVRLHSLFQRPPPLHS